MATSPKQIRDVRHAAAEGAQLGKVVADQRAKPNTPKVVSVKDFLAAARRPYRGKT